MGSRLLWCVVLVQLWLAVVRCSVSVDPDLDCNDPDVTCPTPKPTSAPVIPVRYNSIQGAIDGEGAGSVITLEAGHYTGTANTNLTINIPWETEITLTSANGYPATIIDCQGTPGGIYISPGGAVTLEGITIQNCKGMVRGTSDSALLNLTTGGGIWKESGEKLTIRNCSIKDNSADRGAGIFIYEGEVDIIDSIITSNHAEDEGGGLHISKVTASFEGSTKIYDNSAKSKGGGLAASEIALEIKDTTDIYDNSADDGDEIYCYSSTIRVFYSTQISHLTISDVDCVECQILWANTQSPDYCVAENLKPDTGNLITISFLLSVAIVYISVLILV